MADVKSTETGLAVFGSIRFDNVLCLRQKGAYLIDHFLSSELQVDLSGVLSSDLSGLSLLIRWKYYAKDQEKHVQFIETPSSILKLANVCSISQLLGI